MGTDIHAHVEVKIKGKWYHYSSPNTPRNYSLFALLAGVRDRGEIKPYSAPRGMPADITLITRLDLEQKHYHSHSYITDHEICEIQHRWNKFLKKNNYLEIDFDFNHVFFGYVFGHSFDLSSGELDCFEGDPINLVESVRIVFAFDS